MKKTSMDLVVGATILLALLIMIAGVLWLKEVSVTRKIVRYTVLFPEIGVLQPGDPVMVNGVKMGTVASEALEGIKVKVIINLDKSVILTDSAVVTVQNIGLMGERGVGIRLSDKGSLVQPNSKDGKTSTPIEGRFDTGISEAMGKVGEVLGDVQVVVKNVDQIVKATVGDTSFAPLFKRVAGRLDTVILLVERLVRENDEDVTVSLTKLRQITEEIDRLLKDNQGNINTIIANGTALSTRAVKIAAEVDSVTTTVKTMIAAIDRGEGSIGRMMKDEKFYTDLKRTVGQLDRLITDVNDRGLKLRIKLGYREKK